MEKGILQEPLWDRQPGESAKAFEAFTVYRDLGPSRSIVKTGRKLGKNRVTLEQWSSKFSWVERSAAWDGEQDRVARQAQLDEIKKMRKRHAQVAKKALEKISQALDMMDPEGMSDSGMARLMDTASKLERISRGDVGDVIEERDGGQAIDPVQIYLPDNGRGRGSDSFDDLEV